VADPKGVKAVHANVHVHERVNDHENDNRASFSILDKGSIPFYVGTATTKGVVADELVHNNVHENVVVDEYVHVFVDVGVNGAFYLITQWDVN
jgi:hypothetical protein